MVRSTEYMVPSERNMNGHYNYQNNSSAYTQKHYNQLQHNHQLQHHQQQQGRGASHHHQDREWEPSVNGRPKHRVSSAVAVPTLTQSTSDARREKSERKNARQQQLHSSESTPNKSADPTLRTTNKHQTLCVMQQQQQSARLSQMEPEKLLKTSSSSSSSTPSCIPTSKSYQLHQQQQSKNKYGTNAHKSVSSSQRVPEKIKGVVGGGYQSAAGLSYVGGGLTIHESGVFGVYSETKYMFAVNGLPNNTAQASAAAAFFAR